MSASGFCSHFSGPRPWSRRRFRPDSYHGESALSNQRHRSRYIYPRGSGVNHHLLHCYIHPRTQSCKAGADDCTQRVIVTPRSTFEIYKTVATPIAIGSRSMSEIKNQNSVSFRTFSRRAVSGAPEKLIKEETLRPGQSLPLLIKPAIEGVNLVEWARNNRQFIEVQLF